MTEFVSRDALESKIEAVEARADARFERIMGELRTANAELRGDIQAVGARTLDKYTAAGIAIGMVALIYALLAYGGDMFGLGISVKQVAHEAAMEAASQVAAKKP